MAFSDYNPGFASPESLFMQQNQQPAPASPPPASAWSNAMRTGMANGMPMRQIMAEYNPQLFGNQYVAPPPVLDPAQQLMAQMQAPPTPPPPQGATLFGPYSSPAPAQPPTRPGLERMYQRFPGIATRMGYEPDQQATPPLSRQDNNRKRGR